MIQNLQVKNNLKYCILNIIKNTMSKNNSISCSTCKKIKNDNHFIKSEHSFFKTCIDCRNYSKNHYKINKTKLLKKKYIKIKCECGCVVLKCNLSTHQNSIKHKILINAQQNKPKDTEIKDDYHYKYWKSKIDGVIYYYKSKKKTKKIKCYCGFKFYHTNYDKHITSERHKQFVDFISHCKYYDDKYVLYEKIVK